MSETNLSIPSATPVCLADSGCCRQSSIASVTPIHSNDAIDALEDAAKLVDARVVVILVVVIIIGVEMAPPDRAGSTIVIPMVTVVIIVIVGAAKLPGTCVVYTWSLIVIVDRRHHQWYGGRHRAC
jgi:hypothetical protein